MDSEYSSKDVQSIFFEITDKRYADELKKDIIAGGVPENLVSLKKIRGKDAYRLVIDEGMEQITKIIRVLHGPEYDLDYPQIEELLKIKIEF